MRIALTLLILSTAVSLSAQEAKPAAPAPPGYDAALAERLGADQRGMRAYVFVVLKTGPKTDQTKEESAKLFAGHMANIKRLAALGKLVLAGPFMAENERKYEGIFIFNLKTVKEAEELLVTDPAVAAGRFSYEAYSWYGTAALMDVTSIHNRIDKTSH
ncbi:MAG: YciI family protein [Vicinamibacteria bacterium]